MSKYGKEDSSNTSGKRELKNTNPVRLLARKGGHLVWVPAMPGIIALSG